MATKGRVLLVAVVLLAASFVDDLHGFFQYGGGEVCFSPYLDYCIPQEWYYKLLGKELRQCLYAAALVIVTYDQRPYLCLLSGWTLLYCLWDLLEYMWYFNALPQTTGWETTLYGLGILAVALKRMHSKIPRKHDQRT